ncbi:MAG TPA: LysE family translocator [Candidatus Lumbricidophila sp.]|nr:LysE family translocator [Candidatus Lumbricidophila sp.]
MPPLSNYLAFVAATIVLIFIPGPSMLFIIGRSMALGRIGGLLSVLGNALGMVPYLTIVALGLGALIGSSAVFFNLVKVVGAAYLVYLGIQSIRHRKARAEATLAEDRTRSRWRILVDGFAVGATNPKTIAFFVAVLPQFVDASRGNATLQLAIFGLTFFVAALLGDSLTALVAGTARDWFVRSPRRAEHLATVGGVMLLVLAVALLFTGALPHTAQAAL